MYRTDQLDHRIGNCQKCHQGDIHTLFHRWRPCMPYQPFPTDPHDHASCLTLFWRLLGSLRLNYPTTQTECAVEPRCSIDISAGDLHMYDPCQQNGPGFPFWRATGSKQGFVSCVFTSLQILVSAIVSSLGLVVHCALVVISWHIVRVDQHAHCRLTESRHI